MNMFLAFIKKFIARKKVTDTIFSCMNRQHIKGARNMVLAYLKLYPENKKDTDKLWKAWNMKNLQLSAHRG